MLAVQPHAFLITSLVVPYQLSTDVQDTAVNETDLDPLEFAF